MPALTQNSQLRRRSALLGLRGLTLAALLVAPSACTQSDSPRAQAADTVVVEARRIGQVLPALTVPTLVGDYATVGGAARQPVTLLNLWATFCAPCIAEFPALDSLHQRYKDRGLRVLAVSVDRGDAQVRAFMMAHPVAFRIGRDPAGTITAALSNETLPQNILISADGRVLFRTVGDGNAMPLALIAAIDASLRAP